MIGSGSTQKNFSDLTRREREAHIKRFVSFASSMYVLPLFLLFSIADFFWYKENFILFALIRLISAALIFLSAKYVLKSNDLRTVQIRSLLFVIFCVLPLQMMFYLIGDLSSPYYAGLILTIVGISLGLRLENRFYILALSLNVLPIAVIGSIGYRNLFPGYFLLNFLFLISVCVVSYVGRAFIEELSNTSLVSRHNLALEIESRNEIIDKKTKESLKLHALSKQFSPQILKSIQDGELSLDSNIHRSDLCAIFVDIKDSTAKFISLDRDDLQKVLSLYMEDVMSTFLKHDITIDKFLGDGVLGFSNDPVKQSDYIEKVIKAALEINSRISLKAETYKRYWLSDFEVRIGIATGVASVGFYGSDLHVKSYTAIGKVINLVNRINGVAPTNGIAVSQDVVTKLQNQESNFLRDMIIEDLGVPTLKGFESEKLKIYSLKSKLVKDSTIVIRNGDDPICPHGHGLLFITQSNDGIFNFKCRFCDYILEDEPSYQEGA